MKISWSTCIACSSNFKTDVEGLDDDNDEYDKVTLTLIPNDHAYAWSSSVNKTKWGQRVFDHWCDPTTHMYN